MGARNREEIGLSYLARQATLAGGIDSLESVLELLKSLKIRALISNGGRLKPAFAERDKKQTMK
jgi:hypothetical protein